jgi:acetoin:2,6-dichlorophenolindophenol oxidoreductase subunit alpha
MTTPLTAPARLALFERMLLMRRFEEEVISAAAAHSYIGRNHLYIGHEAVGGPALFQLGERDVTHSTHRNHGHMVARGVDPGKALAEIMGRAGGLCGGKGGTWHMTDPTKGFGSTSAMVGGSIGMSVGAGFARKQQGAGGVSVALFGDGVLDEGISYEAMNYCSKFSLPVLFLCENNSQEGAHITSMLAARSLTDVPASLAIETHVVDGADAEAVHATVARALGSIRADSRPIFIEARLARWPGSHQMRPEHTTGVTDVSLAWNEAAIAGPHADWTRDHDPIRLYARKLIAIGAATQADIIAADARVKAQMAAARAYAEASPFPDAREALVDVFA